MRSLTARDLMIPLETYPWVNARCTLKEAARTLETTQLEVGGITSMPRLLLVFDDDGALVGMVRRRDILRGLGPDLFMALETEVPAAIFPVDADPNLIELLTHAEFEKLEENAQRPVSDVMQDVAGTVTADETMVSVLQRIARDNYYLLPVLDDGKVIGVVRTVDVLNRVLQSLD